MAAGNKKLFNNIFSLGVIQVANYVFPLISIPIISRIIGPDKLGAINFIGSFVAYFILLIGYGFDLTATRRIAKAPDNIDNRNKVFSEVFCTQCVLLLISIVIFSILVIVVPEFRKEKVVAAFTFLTCFATCMTQNWLFQAMQDLTKVALLNVFSKVIFTVVVLALVTQKSDYIWQPFALSLAQMAVAVASFFWAVKKYNLRLKWVGLLSCFKLLWQEKTFFFSLCIINLYTNTNILILGVMQDATEVGYYTAGQKLISIIQSIVLMPLTTAFFPYIGKAFGENREKGLIIARQLIPIVVALTLIAGVSVWIGAPTFINLFYGEQFYAAVIICRVLAFIPLILALESILGIHLMLNLNMEKTFFKITVVGAIASLLLNYSLVDKLGYIGSAFSWVATELTILCLFFWALKRAGVDVIDIKYFKLQGFVYIVKAIFSRTFVRQRLFEKERTPVELEIHQNAEVLVKQKP